MKKTKENSYFRLVSGSELPKIGKKILQIHEDKVYDNVSGYAVFLCEIETDEEEGEDLNE